VLMRVASLTGSDRLYGARWPVSIGRAGDELTSTGAPIPWLVDDELERHTHEVARHLDLFGGDDARVRQRQRHAAEVNIDREGDVGASTLPFLI